MDILDYTGTKFINSPIDLPTIGGNSGEKGKTGVIVQLYIGIKLFEVPVDPKTGLFTWTATEPFPDGDYSVSIRTLDRAGNLSAPTLRTMRIDTTPPDAPELLFLTDDQGPKTGLLEAGQTTDDKRPKLTGIAQADAIVYLRDADGNTIGSARADKVTGKWEMEPVQDLRDGDNNLTLVAEETFGGVTREGAPSASFKIIIGADSGTLPRDTIIITQAIDDAGSATGVLSNGALTDDTTPTLNGVVSAGSTVTVYYRLAGSNIWAGSATASVTGESWTWTPDSALPTGTYEFQASIGDKSSALFSLDIAAGADDIQKKTRIDSAQDDFGTWQGPLSNGAITDDTTPTLSGRGEANGKVVVRYGVPANTVVVDVDSSGHWTWTPAPALTAGNWNFDVQPQGHTKWSETFSLSITDASGFNPVITHAYDDVGTPGNLANGDTTDDTTPTLHGRAEANSTLTLRYRSGGTGSYASVQVEADSAGNWSWTPSALQNGSWSFEVQKAGQSGWNGLSLTIDSSADRNPVIDYAADNVGSVRDPLGNGDTTDDTTPTLHGTAAANGAFTLRYRLDSGSWTSVSLTANSSGNWSWTPPALKNGNWTFEVQKAGQNDWDSMGLTIDSTSDRSPVISYAADNVGSVRDNLGNGDTTDDTTPTLHGTAAANGAFTLRYRLDSGSWTSVSLSADSSGNWSWTPPTLANGNWTFEVQKAGQSNWSTLALTIDTFADVTPLIAYAEDNVGDVQTDLFNNDTTDDTTPTLHGTAAPNSEFSLRYRLDTGSWTTIKLNADRNGNWFWTPSALQNGKWTFGVQKAGQSGWKNISLFIDSDSDRSPVIDYAEDNVGAKQDNVLTGGTTDDVTPTLHGTSGANALVYLQASNGSETKTYSFHAESSGDWTWTPPADLALGNWAFKVSKTASSGFGDAFNLNISTQLEHNENFKIDGEPTIRDEDHVTLDSGLRFYANTNIPFKFTDGFNDLNGNYVARENLRISKATGYNSASHVDAQNIVASEIEVTVFSIIKPSTLKIYTFYAPLSGGSRNATLDLIMENNGYYTYRIKATGGDSLHQLIFEPFNTLAETVYVVDISWTDPLKSSTLGDHYTSTPLLNDEYVEVPYSTDIKNEEIELNGEKIANESSCILLNSNKNMMSSTLKIDIDALLHSGEKDLFIEDGKTQLVINGDEGDVVQLVDILPEGSDISEWQHQEGTVTVAGVEYNVYSHDDAELLVQQGVKTELI